MTNVLRSDFMDIGQDQCFTESFHGYFSFYFYDFSIIFRNCSDSLVFFIFPFISMIFLLDLGTVLTVWYYMFFLLFL
jgi:hypothetical protein